MHDEWVDPYIAGIARGIEIVAELIETGTMPADGPAGLRRDAARYRQHARGEVTS